MTRALRNCRVAGLDDEPTDHAGEGETDFANKGTATRRPRSHYPAQNGLSGRQRRGRVVIAAVVPPVVTMTDTAGRQHYVTDDAAAAGRRSGRYVGVCGSVVVAASLTAPDGYPCCSCARWGGERA